MTRFNSYLLNEDKRSKKISIEELWNRENHYIQKEEDWEDDI